VCPVFFTSVFGEVKSDREREARMRSYVIRTTDLSERSGRFRVTRPEMTVGEFVDAVVTEQGLLNAAPMRFACLNGKMLGNHELLCSVTSSDDDIFVWAVEDPKTRMFRLCSTYQTSMRVHHRVKFSTKHEKIRNDELEEFEHTMTKACRELQDMEEMYHARGEGNDIPCFTVVYVISDIQSVLQGFELCPSIYAQLLQKKNYLEMARAMMKVMKKSSHNRMVQLFDDMLVVMNLEVFQTFFAGEKRCAYCTCAGSLNKCAACNTTFYCKAAETIFFFFF
jgi:hypothetical protein